MQGKIRKRQTKNPNRRPDASKPVKPAIGVTSTSGVVVADFAFFQADKAAPEDDAVVDREPAGEVFAQQGTGLCIQVANFVDGFDAVGEGNAEGKQQVLDLLNQQIR